MSLKKVKKNVISGTNEELAEDGGLEKKTLAQLGIKESNLLEVLDKIDLTKLSLLQLTCLLSMVIDKRRQLEEDSESINNK